MSSVGQKQTSAVQKPCLVYPKSGHVQRNSPMIFNDVKWTADITERAEL